VSGELNDERSRSRDPGRPMSASQWQDTLRHRLVARNARDAAYATIIEQCKYSRPPPRCLPSSAEQTDASHNRQRSSRSAMHPCSVLLARSAQTQTRRPSSSALAMKSMCHSPNQPWLTLIAATLSELHTPRPSSHRSPLSATNSLPSTRHRIRTLSGSSP
jgi:hypothetical protein